MGGGENSGQLAWQDCSITLSTMPMEDTTPPPPGWYLDDLAAAILWGGAPVEEAGVVGAALGVAEPPRQVWVSLEVSVVGDRDRGRGSWWEGRKRLGP